MFRRLLALMLWTYFAWYLGALIAVFLGGPGVMGPVAAAVMAAVAVTGWFRTSSRRQQPFETQLSH